MVTVTTWKTILQAGALQRYKLHVYCTCQPANKYCTCVRAAYILHSTCIHVAYIALVYMLLKYCTCIHAAYAAPVNVQTNTVCVNALLQRLCAEKEGSLVSAHSPLEYNFLQRLAKTGGHTFAWLGGYNFLVSTHSHACTHGHRHTHTCTHAHRHTHTCTHAHRHTHAHAHTCKYKWLCLLYDWLMVFGI